VLAWALVEAAFGAVLFGVGYDAGPWVADPAMSKELLTAPYASKGHTSLVFK